MPESGRTLLLVGRPGPLRNALQSLIASMRPDLPITADGSLLALKRMREYGPRLVVVDGGLADTEAIELVQEIKREQATVRILALADRDQQGQHLFAAGADRVLPTGTSFGQLAATLEQLLANLPSEPPGRMGGGDVI